MTTNASYGLTAPAPEGSPCEWCRGGPATKLVEVTPPKVIERGARKGDVDIPGVSARLCDDCGARIQAKLDAKRAEEERIREEKAKARRKAAAERRAAARSSR